MKDTSLLLNFYVFEFRLFDINKTFFDHYIQKHRLKRWFEEIIDFKTLGHFPRLPQRNN